MTKGLYTAVSIILFIALIFSCSIIVDGRCRLKVERDFYPKCATIETVDREHDIVIVADCSGFLWGFSGCEDWEVGDVVAMIMNTRGTPEIFDDVIVQTRCAF